MSKLTPLQEAERAIICVLLNDPHAIIPLLDILTTADMFEVPTHQTAYAAIIALTRADVLPNVYTVADKAGLPVAELQALALGFNTKLSREILYTAEIVRKEADRRRVRYALTQAVDLASSPTDDAKGLAVVCAEMVVNSVDEVAQHDAGISAVSGRFDAEVRELASGTLGYSLGNRLAWLQGKTSGLRQGQVWVISAAYKQRKTTLLRNMLIAVCRAGASVDLFALEGNAVDSYAGLTAILATEWLLRNGYPDQANVSETFLLRGLRTPEQQQAITEARAEIDGWQLRIYDGRAGITQPERLMHIIKRDRLIHSLDVFALDYLQLLGTGKLFDRMEDSTHRLQRVTIEEGLTAILLAQLNEATIGQSADSYSPGVKGGGDAAAAADFLIRTKYNSEGTPDILTIQLKLARHARPGTQNYRINPQSGLIVAPYGAEAVE